MKITQSTVNKIQISEIEHMDPVSVYFEDFGPGQGQAIIKCWNKSWTSFWGGCGDNGIMSFFMGCDKYYLVKNFMAGEDMTETDIEETIKSIKRKILSLRMETVINKKETRDFWDTFVVGDYESLESAFDIYEIREWVKENYEIDGHHLFDDWTDLIETKLTSNAHWLRDRIIPTIQEALTELDKEKVA